MNTGTRTQQVIAIVAALAALALITVVGKQVAGLNAITVALLYLLVVLAVSALADLACGIAVAVVSGLLVNYFFLPPFGTFYIAAPEDWVAFFAYIATAVVVSYFAATVRRRAVEADHLQAQLKHLSQLTKAVAKAGPDNVSLEVLTHEVKDAFQLVYCAIYLFGETGVGTPVSAGIRPSRASSEGKTTPGAPGSLLDVIVEEGPDVRCLALKDQRNIIGTLVISQTYLSSEGAEALAELVSLVVGRREAQGC